MPVKIMRESASDMRSGTRKGKDSETGGQMVSKKKAQEHCEGVAKERKELTG